MIFNTTIYKAGEGGGAGTELVVPAIGSVQTAEVNTKVLLVYANEVGGTDIAVENNTSTSPSTVATDNMYGSSFELLQWRRTGGQPANSCNQCKIQETQEGYTVSAWNFHVGGSSVAWDIDPVVGIGTYWYGTKSQQSIGFGSGSNYRGKVSGINNGPLYGVKGAFVIDGYAPMAYVYNEKEDTMVQVGTESTHSYWPVTVLYENEIYVLGLAYNNVYKVNKTTGETLETITLEGPSLDIDYYGVGYALTPSGDYFLTWSNAGDVWLNKLTKGTTWSYERLENLPVASEGDIRLIRAKEDGESIHVYIVPFDCNDIDNVKHYIVDKATGSVERGADLLDTTGYDKILTAAFDMEKSRASFILANSTTRELKCVVSGLDTMLPYEYAAVPFNSANLTDSAVTGFIKSQDGTDDLGNSIATVEVLLDPNATPPSANRLIGMNVTVNEGEPL